MALKTNSGVDVERKQPFRLCNRVWDGGYKFVNLDDGRRFLAATGANDGVVNSKAALLKWNLRWALKDIPHVCREFASLSNENEIEVFASKYGQLLTTTSSEFDSSGNQVSGLSRDNWTKAVRDVRFWLETWDFVRERNTKALRERITFDPEGPWITTPTGFSRIGGYLPPVSFSKSNVLKPGRFAVRDAINERLEWYPVGASLFVQNDVLTGSGFDLAFRASGLLAIVWMQIAQEVAGTYSCIECKFCAAPFYPKRNTARFCSDVCRVNEWNKNKPKN